MPLSANPQRVLQATILVVEDSPAGQLMVLESLRKHGFHRLVTADNGQDALETLRTVTPDLIVTDLMMPHIDGFALCREIRSQPHLRDVPILALTALGNEKARLGIFGMGASDLVRKPVNEEELVARCRIHLEKRYILKDLQDYQARVEEDLGNARAMQNLLLPDSEAIAAAERQYGLGISALFAPSFTIGGDFWGMRPLNAHKLAVYLGDFTGHGVTAAINVFRLCALMEKLPLQVLARPAACFTQLNAQLHAILPIQLFATMFYGVLDITRNRLTYSIAGCPPPLKLDGTGRYALLGGAGLPLAASAAAHYHEYKCDFLRGDALLLYSDALIETPDAQDGYLPIDHIARALLEMPAHARNAEAMLQRVVRMFGEFTARGAKDDLTLNIYKRDF